MKVYTTFQNLQDVAQKEDFKKADKRVEGNHPERKVLKGRGKQIQKNLN